jgi:hypothetical protein
MSYPLSVEDDEESRLLSVSKLNKAYESKCWLRMWEIGIPAFATLACIVCMYVCENCLIGVMLFCVLLCFKDWVLVLVFFVSLGLFIAKHPLDSHSMHKIANAGYEIVKSE